MKQRLLLVGLLVFFGLVVTLNVLRPQRPSHTSGTTVVEAARPKVPAREINASVRFTGTQFIVTNDGPDDWADATFSVNAGVFAGGYEVHAGALPHGQRITIGALQFANSDGQRFNPLQVKPQTFRILDRGDRTTVKTLRFE